MAALSPTSARRSPLIRGLGAVRNALLAPAWAYSGARVTHYYNQLLATHGLAPQALAERAEDKDRAFYHQLLDGLALEPGLSVLDIGCGMGDLLAFLEARQITPGSYLGVDLVQGFLDHCQATHPAPYRFERANFVTQRFAPGERYDLVVSMGVMVSRVIAYPAYVAACVEKMLGLANRYVVFNMITEVDRSQGNYQQAHKIGAITFLPRPQLERIVAGAARAYGADFTITERRIYSDATDAFVRIAKPPAR
ncbi:MAG TPA: methyltransferase domain-containing protein [Kouleothrix sp.]|mgnify:CR=1 FL=1|uniref:methyltransferase domain-containing protein n=1 Tax=Kouleothrix sp. TaxID=2779161 RepID=UPI002CA99EE9|nr:methyltransferase domain-containing protein [Kouleothrix sp.]HRC76247.1 methyltransferase domain-containing protein [Kouleothrix sp.]